MMSIVSLNRIYM